jgi:hypothetical protein
MQKEIFLKEVTAFFSASKLHELSAFLQENKNETIAHKKFIKSLNKQLGQPFITATITDLEKLHKEERKAFLKSLESINKKNDEAALFDILKPISFDEQISDYEIVGQINNDNLYSKFIKNIIDNKEQLSERNQKYIRNLCLGKGYQLSEDLANYYCNSTNNIDDKISFVERKCEVYVNSQKRSVTEKEEIVNQLFDLLSTHKADSEKMNPSFYFSCNVEQYVYLNEENAKKIENINTALDPVHVVQYLSNMSASALNHYLENQGNGFKLDVPFDLYSSLINTEIKLDKLFIDKDAEFTNEQIAKKFNYNPRYILKIVSDQKLQNFLKSQETKITIPEEFEGGEVINNVLWELTKDEVDTIFNKSEIFNLSEKQQAIIDDYLNNHEKNLLKTINLEKNMPGNIGHRVIQAYIDSSLDDVEFISKLTPEGKKLIISSYLDYSKIEDGEKFINNFMRDLPKEEYSCFHLAFNNHLEGNKNQTAIMSYLLNEKTDFTSHSVYHSVEMFHLLNDEKKKEMVGNILKQKNERNHFESYYQQMEKHSDSPQEKLNLKEVKNLYDSLIAAKVYATKQQKKYKAKKN